MSKMFDTLKSIPILGWVLAGLVSVIIYLIFGGKKKPIHYNDIDYDKQRENIETNIKNKKSDIEEKYKKLEEECVSEWKNFGRNK